MATKEEGIDLGSTVQEEEEEEEEFIVEDGELAGLMTQLLDEADADEGTNGMVKYKKATVKVDMRDVMVHVVDNMKDHFGRVGTEPKCDFVLSPLSHIAYDEKYKSKGDEPGDRWFTQVSLSYKEVRSIDLPVIAIDNVFIDLSPRINKDGTPVKNYGKTWVNAYFPKSTMKVITEKFKSDTKWSVSNKGITVDEQQSLASIVLNMNLEDGPRFYVMSKEENDRGEFTGRIVTTNKGSVQSMYAQEEYRAIYKATLFCNLSMSVLTSVGTTVVPVPDKNAYARLKFSLASVKAYAVAPDIKSVTLGGNKPSNKLF
jgi:hypothetical protein